MSTEAHVSIDSLVEDRALQLSLLVRRDAEIRVECPTSREHVRFFEAVDTAMLSLHGCDRVWYLNAEYVGRFGYHGAGLPPYRSRKVADIERGLPAGIVCNVQSWRLAIGPRSIVFLPDRVLEWTSDGIRSFDYRFLTAASSTLEVEETAGLHSDVNQVGKRWRHRCLDGTPDMRYHNNPSVVVAQYGVLKLTLGASCSVALVTSRYAAADEVANGLCSLPPSPPAPPSPDLAHVKSQDVRPGQASGKATTTASAISSWVDKALVVMHYVATANIPVSVMAVVEVRQNLIKIDPEFADLAKTNLGFEENDFIDSSDTQLFAALATIQQKPLSTRKWFVARLWGLAASCGVLTATSEERVRFVEQKLLGDQN